MASKKTLNTLLFSFFLFDYITSFEVGYLGLCFGKVMKFSVFYMRKYLIKAKKKEKKEFSQ